MDDSYKHVAPLEQMKLLTPTIRRVTVRTDQQRNVIMLGTVVDIEYDRHLRIETRDAERRKVWLSVKDQPIGAIGDRTIDEKERFHATIGVGPCMAQLGPALVSVLYLETNRDTAGR